MKTNLKSNREKEQPQYILIDIDDTVYNYLKIHKDSVKHCYEINANKLGMSFKRFNNLYIKAKKIIKLNNENRAASHSKINYFKNLLYLNGNFYNSYLSLKLHTDYYNFFFKNIKLRPYAKKFLKLAKEKKIKVIAITNMTSEIQLKKLAKLKIDDLFFDVLTSEEVGIEKPNKRIFEYAIKKYKLNNSKVWMIGDSYVNDIEPIKNYKSINGFLFEERISKNPSYNFQKFNNFKILIDSF